MTAAAAEDEETRRRRLRIRAWRRGTREMDLILGPFADSALATLDAEGLAAFEAVLEQNDQDLYLWVTGQAEPPAALAPLLARIGAEARARLAPSSGQS